MQWHYKKIGQGMPLVILHGLYGNSDNWHTIGKILAEKYEVYLPDLRNHGKSPHSNEHNYEILQQDLFEFLTKLNIKKAIIVGHSMGGKTAMLFALMHPEFVEKLVIVDIAPKSYKSLLDFNPQIIEHLNIINAYLSVNIGQMKSRTELDHAFAVYIKSNHLRHFLLKNASRDSTGKFLWLINIEALKRALPEVMDWPKIDKLPILENRIPTLFIRGEKSNHVNDSDLKEIKQLFPLAEVTTIFDAGHWVHAEQQALFLNALNVFLETV